MQVSNGFGGGFFAHQISFAPVFRGPVADSAAQPQTPAQTPAQAPAAAAPNTAGTYFPQSQFGSPIAVFGSPFAAGFGGGYGYSPAQGGGATAGAAAATSGGHTVANPTNSLASNPAGNPGVASQGGFGGLGNFGYAQPAFLVPAIVPAGIPVMFAIGVFAFAPAVAPTPTATPPAAPVVDDVVADSPAVPETVTPPAVSDDVVVVPDEDNAAADPDPEPPVQVLTNPEFESYKESFDKQSLETSLVLSLTTAEGDEITLDFRQLDVMRSESFEGAKLSGSNVLRDDSGSSTDRYVTMDVIGEISDAEQAAIDAVLANVTEVANAFFGGSYQDAMGKLSAMDFDSGQLSELSLSMTMTRTAATTGGYREGADQLDQLLNQGGEIVEALEFLATEQRRMIDQAKEVLDDGSAAKLVRGLMPLMLEDTVHRLREQVAAADPVVATVPAAAATGGAAASESLAGSLTGVA
ncbi:MAG: hypothetical protein AB8B93_13520 [Pseudomonadales bacterium]